MTHWTRFFAVMVTSIVACSTAQNAVAVEFGAAKIYPVGTDPIGAIVGDFNGDGKPDIAVANSGSGNVSILLGNGDGTFQAAVNFDVGITTPSSIATGDFNGDGKLDLAVFRPGDVQAGVAGAVSILLGNGNGTFQAPKTLAFATVSSRLVVADLNVDKKFDLAVSEFDSTTNTLTVDIFLSKGDGTFQAAMSTSVPNPANGLFVAADFNQDLKPDLAVNTQVGVLILLGKGDGTFQLGAMVPTKNGFIPLSISIGNFNNDMNPDLLVRSFQSKAIGLVHPQEFGLFLGNGDGTFQQERPAGGYGYYYVGDINGDGKQDLFSSLAAGLGRGDGTFSPPVQLNLGLNLGVSISAAADLNGDELIDMIALDSANNSISVILNTSQTDGADLAINSSGASPEPVGVGTNLTYSADVLNEGPKNATGVMFTDTLPSGVSFVSATATQGNCIQSKGIVSCNIGSLASAFDTTISIVTTPTVSGTITNTVNVRASEQDTVPANNSAMQSTTVLPFYTLTVSKTGPGTGTLEDNLGANGGIYCGSICSTTYLSGTVIGVGAFPDPNSLLNSWGGACSGNPPGNECNLTMDADKKVTANFVLGVTLNVTISGGGTGTVASGDGSITCVSGSCSSLKLPGTSVSLTATPSAGSVFGGWSGACTGTDPCSVTLNTSQSVTATFNPPPDFALQPAATSLTLNRGAQVSDALTFPAQGGFSGTIAVTCTVSGPAPMPACGVSPNSVTPGNTATLTVSATALSAAITPQSFGEPLGLYAAWLPVGLMGCLLAIGPNKKRRLMWVLDLLVMAAAIFPAACGGGSSSPPKRVPQTYMVSVTARSGAIQHTGNITVTVP